MSFQLKAPLDWPRTPLEWSPKLYGDLSLFSLPAWAAPLACDDSLPVFNPHTEFLSACLLALFEAVISVLSILPVLLAIYRLRSQESGKGTVHGRVAYIAALLAPLFRLSAFFVQNETPGFVEWLVIVTGLLVAALHLVQDGRVLVPSSELLLYWLAIAPSAVGVAADAYLRGTKGVWLFSVAAVFSVIAFVAELRNDRASGKSSYDTVNIFEKTTMTFMTELLDKGGKGQLTREDLPEAVQGLNSYNSHHKLIDSIESLSEDNKYRVMFGMLKAMKSEVIGIVILETITEALTYARPFALSLFLGALTEYGLGKTPLFHAVYYAILTGILPLLATATMNLYALLDAFIQISGRAALVGLVYRKAMKLSPQARETYDSGKIMNMINVDTDQVITFLNVLPNLVSAPVAIIISTWQLYSFIGKSMFAAIPLYILLAIMSSLISRVVFGMFPRLMGIKDSRTKATSNAFRNIKSVKLYAWEEPLTERIDIIRREELGYMRTITLLFSIMGGIWSTMSDLVAVAIFAVYLYFNQGALVPDVVFPVLALLMNLSSPFMMLPMIVTALGQAITSQTRIKDLYTQEEQDYANITHLKNSDGFDDDVVSFKNATVSWNGDSAEEKVALKDLSFSAGNGDLICVVGKVGSGKTALLKALCGEIKTISGSITVKGDVAYCSQESWLENKSVKDNVLFGREYDKELYDKVIEGCDLVKDLDSLALKDLTEVGERGISLSGGQKARVALARAVYTQADIYVLDDVLSAVDEHVSAHLIEGLLSKDGILSSKTIILATNNVKVLCQASKILALNDKKIVEQGSLQYVLENQEKSEIFKLMKDFGTGGKLDASTIVQRRAHVSASTVRLSRPPLSHVKPSLLSDQEDEEKDKPPDYSIFGRYFKFAGIGRAWLALGVMVASVLVLNAVTIWLGIFSNHGFSSLSDAKFYMSVYLLLILTSISGVLLSSYTSMVMVAIRASQNLHHVMLQNTMRGKMGTFDATPLGRLLNRFTGDMANIDNKIPNAVYYFVRSGFNTIYAAVVVAVGAPFVIIIGIPVAFLANYYRRIYIPGSRQISRMTSAANSPILSHIEESIKGAAIVRTFGAAERFIDVLDYRVDYWIDLMFIKLNTRRWLLWRVQGLTAILGLVSALSIVFLVAHNWLSVGFAGVVMYNTVRLGIMVQQTILFWAEFELSGVSLDRIFDYIDNDQEAPAHIEETKPADCWPAKGKIHFNEYSARYKEDGQDVLKKLSFSISSQEKIGIVGRTGSGKSTLTLGLFRLLEPSSGNIDVDGVDTSSLGLYDLRSRLAIIPQDAQIFEGTLRENLDPIGLVDDDRLWEILDLCHLKEHFTKLETGLETKLVDGGDNLSRGQAQLICLGRALVHDTKVLVLDEATASVDVETDKILQQTIRSEFKDRTILTIAHRLNTIMDSDKIMVLEKGELVEFDTPAKLLESKGYFWSLHQAMLSESDQ